MVPPIESATCDAWNSSACEGTPYCPPRCPRFFDSEGTPIHVRTLEAGDLDRVVTMYDELDASSRTMGLPPISRDDIRAWLERLDGDGWNLVALDDGTAAGHVGVVPPDGGGDGPQFVIFVHQAYRGRGIGTELIKQVVAHAADRQYGALTLAVSEGNGRAIDIYEDIGFEIEAESKGSNVVGMSLPLSHPIADRVRLPPAEQ